MDITLKQAYDIFIADRETSCADETIIYYRENLTNFFKYCSDCFYKPYDQILCVDMTREIFSNYIKYLRRRPKFYNHPFLDPSDDVLSATSVRTYCRSIKVFGSFCEENDYCRDFTKGVKLPKDDSGEIIPLYESEVKMIDKCCNLKTELGLRNWCIVHLMLDAGLRSSEVINLRFCDLMFDKNIIQIWKGKGSKTRLLILCPRLKVNIMKYCVLYRNYTQLPENTRVFIQMKKHEPINSNVLKQFFSRLKKKTGIERVHPHLCRHTFATSYILGGGSLEMLRLLLGHSDYDVTRMYLHLAHQSQMLHSDVYKLDPVYFKKLT
nr:site-specific integrase [uncultured Blautia sp.]